MFAAELILGFWRSYSALDPSLTVDDTTRLPPPRRLILPHLESLRWRDYSMKSPYILRNTLPSLSLEFASDWQDRVTFSPDVLFVFDRILIADRSAAMLGNHFMSNYRTTSAPMDLPGSAHWFSNNVIGIAGVDRIVGRDGKPVVTSMSRQSTLR